MPFTETVVCVVPPCRTDPCIGLTDMLKSGGGDEFGHSHMIMGTTMAKAATITLKTGGLLYHGFLLSFDIF